MPDFDLGLVLGSDGEDAPKIESIEKTSTSGLVDTYTITLEDGSEYTFDVTNGSDGSSVSVTQVLSSGTKLATITIDGTSTDLYCNSGGGSADIVTSWESTLSDTKVPSEKLTKNTIDTKLDKNQGSGNSGKYLKVDTDGSVIPATGGGGSVDIVTSWESTLSDSKVPSEKLTKETIDTKISKSNTAGLVKNDGTIDTNTHLISTDIVNDLTTGGTTKVLSAEQGKALNTLIGNAISYINQ